MDNSKQHIIHKIAQELDCGFDCYYHTKTDEVIAIPSSSYLSYEGDDKETFAAALKKIEIQKVDFIKIEVLESSESFKIMERFVTQLLDKKLQAELEHTLTLKHPFQNFKYVITQSDSKQHWYDFKQNELERIVKRQMNY